jgi:hypothetical protein
MDGLKKMVEVKAMALESEVGALRVEGKSPIFLINGFEPSEEQTNKN